MTEEKGVAQALAFVHDSVYPDHGYGVVHTMLHVVGEITFDREHDLSKVFAYMDPYIDEVKFREHLGGFDGFYHGAIIAYFIYNRDLGIDTLIHDVCESNLKLPGLVTSSIFFCYHTVGHALLHFTEGDVAKAVKTCDVQKTEERQSGCYYGTFMEQAFLYNSEYHPDFPRRFDTHTSMGELCAAQKEKAAEYCATFIAQSYLATHTADIQGAFDECAKFPQFKDRCVFWIGYALIPSLANGSETKIKEYCDLGGGAYVSECMRLAKQGMRI